MIRLTLPFRMLVPDNRKMTRTRSGRLLLTPRYRAGKAAMSQEAARQYRGGCWVGPLALTARVWFPDARRRDAGNLRKGVTDALIGVCYADDVQLTKETWEVMGVDRLNPRLELEITSR